MMFLHQPNLRLQTISGATGTSDLMPWTVLLRHLPAAEVDQSNATTCSKLLRPIVCALVFASRPGNCKLCRDAWVVSGADLKWDDGGCQAATGQQFFCFQGRSREIHPLRERRDAVICRITANVYLLVLRFPSTSLMSDDGRPTHHQTPFYYHFITFITIILLVFTFVQMFLSDFFLVLVFLLSRTPSLPLCLKERLGLGWDCLLLHRQH